jgi:hypothetical protein
MRQDAPTPLGKPESRFIKSQRAQNLHENEATGPPRRPWAKARSQIFVPKASPTNDLLPPLGYRGGRTMSPPSTTFAAALGTLATVQRTHAAHASALGALERAFYAEMVRL